MVKIYTFIKKLIFIGYLLFSIAIIIFGIMFILSQMVNLKYYFDNNSSVSCYPFDKDFILELVFYAKIIVFYSFGGLLLSVYFLRNKNGKN